MGDERHLDRLPIHRLGVLASAAIWTRSRAFAGVTGRISSSPSVSTAAWILVPFRFLCSSEAARMPALQGRLSRAVVDDDRRGLIRAARAPAQQDAQIVLHHLEDDGSGEVIGKSTRGHLP